MIKLRLEMSAYLKATVVLAIDVIVSLIASICVLMFVYDIAPSVHSSVPFSLKWMGAALGASGLAFYFTRVYRLIIRYSTLKDIGKLSVAVLVKEVILFAVMSGVTFQNPFISLRFIFYLILIDFFVTLGFLVTVRVMMLAVYQFITNHLSEATQKKQVLVYGTGGKAASLVTRLRNSKQYRIVGFLKYGPVSKDQILA